MGLFQRPFPPQFGRAVESLRSLPVGWSEFVNRQMELAHLRAADRYIVEDELRITAQAALVKHDPVLPYCAAPLPSGIGIAR